MKRFVAACTMFLLGLGFVVSVGCLPRQLVAWSPDGNRAVVMDANSTSLCDGSGKLASLDIGPAQAAAWAADSKRVLLAVQKSATKWAELAEVLDEPTRQAVIAAAGDLEKAIQATPGGEELTDKETQEIAKTVFVGRNSLAPAAMVYLRDARPDVMRKRLGKKWDDMAKLSVPYTQLGLYDLDGMSLKPGPVILNSLKAVNELRLPPAGKAVAYVTGSDRTENSFTLWLAPTTAKATPRELADRVAVFPDFSADGQNVVYIQAAGTDDGKPLVVGRLAIRQVADANGTILAELPDAKDLATLVFDNASATRCLADGRILFSSGDANIPATFDDTQGPKSLFVYNPGRPAKVTRIVPADSKTQLPVALLFELSPDQRQVSVAGNDANVCVLTLADGQVTWVQQEGREDKLKMLPSWRKPGELCFLIPPNKETIKNEDRCEVALWSAGKITVISKAWPDSVMENLNFAPSPKKPTTAPTTEPAPAGAPAK